MSPIFVALAIPQAPTPARASAILPSVDFQGVEAREAIRQLLRRGLFGGVVAPDVRGTVTLHLQNVTWEAALRGVLSQVDAIYRFDHGFVDVTRRPTEPPPVRVPWPGVSDRQAIETAYRWLRYKIALGQGKEIAPRLAGMAILNPGGSVRAQGEAAYRMIVDTDRRYSSFEIVSAGPPHGVRSLDESRPFIVADVAYAGSSGGPKTHYTDWWFLDGKAWRLLARRQNDLAFVDAEPGEVLNATLGDAGARWTLDPSFDWKLTVDLTGLPFDKTLDRLTDTMDARYRLNDGEYRFAPRGDDDRAPVAFMEFDRADVRVVLSWLFQKAGVRFHIAPAVKGSVTVSLRNVAFASALANVTRQVGATYRIARGAYEVVPQGKGRA